MLDINIKKINFDIKKWKWHQKYKIVGKKWELHTNFLTNHIRRKTASKH